MKIRLLRDCKLGRRGGVIDTPYVGMANLMIKLGKAELVEDPPPVQHYSKRQRKTEKAVTNG